MEWAKSLKIASDESVEERLRTIFSKMENKFGNIEILIEDIDATSNTGNQLTQRINDNQQIQYSAVKMIELLKEDGQIFELLVKASVVSNIYYFIVRDGFHLDVLGKDKSIVPLLGHTIDLDPGWYESYWKADLL